jgi:hypothetical protein
MNSVINIFVGVLLGIGLTAVLAIIVVWYLKKKAEEKKPYVWLIELDTFRHRPLGRFKKIEEDIHIEVEGQERFKRFWGIRTDYYFILPSNGTQDDIIMKDPNDPQSIFLICSVIGYGYQENAHNRWIEKAFPPDIYENPSETLELPDNYILVEPYGERNWIMSRYRSMRQLFTQVNAITTRYERDIENIHNGYGRLITAKIQSWNEILASGFKYLLDGWDITKKYTITPIMVLCRLMHLPLNRLVYSGLAQTLSGGGMRQIAEIAKMMRGGLEAMNHGFGKTAIDEPLLIATQQKGKEIMQRLAQSEQESKMYKDKLSQVLQAITAGTQGGRASPSRQMEGLPQIPEGE